MSVGSKRGTRQSNDITNQGKQSKANRQFLLEQLPRGPLKLERFKVIETPPPRRVAASPDASISFYDTAATLQALRGAPGLIFMKRLTMCGFLVMDLYDQRDRAMKNLRTWVAAGQLKVKEDILDGLDNTSKALIRLLYRDNMGKRIVRVQWSKTPPLGC